MFVKQLYTNCLAEAAYYIESDGEAAIIDPLRDTAPYIELAKSRNAAIRYVFETHFHADFVSGHIDLANATGAQIVYGPNAEAQFDIYVAEDHEKFELGDVKIQVLHTPGHTLESSCFLLLDENNNPHSVFTGDTLFVGDVGRPDLAAGENIDTKALAAMLYDSIQSKLVPLEDEVVVFPGHGPGSQCGKALGLETTSTIGKQKATNYALQTATKDEFVESVTDGIMPPSSIFPKECSHKQDRICKY